jgi:hypothetical protein
MKKHDIISNTNSEITHVMFENKLRHAIVKTLIIANDSTHPDIDNFLFIEVYKRASYYEGKVYTNTYYMFLD